ncbi:hypothetical protein E4U58_002859, partial [Claviceps cyperi]
MWLHGASVSKEKKWCKRTRESRISTHRGMIGEQTNGAEYGSISTLRDASANLPAGRRHSAQNHLGQEPVMP